MQPVNQKRWWVMRAGAIWVSLLLVLICVSSPGAAYSPTTWVITSTDDSGPGTLRQAIADAAPGDVIVFDASLVGATITLTSGELLIDKDLTIDGGAAYWITLSGGYTVRVIHVAESAEVTLRNLIITRGSTADAAAGESAAGGGGIFNEGRLHLWACIVVTNTTGDGGDVYQTPGGLWVTAGNGGNGAGIYSTGELEVQSSSIGGNFTGNGGNKCVECPYLLFEQGHGGSGGGVYATGVLTVTNSQIMENATGNAGRGMPHGKGGDGAGIYVTGQASIDGSVVVVNHAGAGSNACVIAAFPYTGDCAGGSGGAIYSKGTLTMIDSQLIGNRAGEGWPGGSGGGLAGSGSVAVMDSTFDSNIAGEGMTILDNSATNWGLQGGNGGDGGGLKVWGDDFTLLDSRVVNNLSGDGGGGGNTANSGGWGGSAGRGGGVFAQSAHLSISNSTISSNRGGTGGDGGYGGNRCGKGGDGGHGGGAFLQSTGDVESSTFSENYGGDGGLSCENTRNAAEHGAGGSGGGIYNSFNPLTISNTTISGNSTGHGGADLGAAGYGGGLYVEDITFVRNSTITGNITPGGGNGGGLSNEFAYLELSDTLLAGNRAGVAGPDCWGHFVSAGYNLVQDATACQISGNLTSNILGRPALIGPLALNAPGTTETHALLPTSPAIDAGSCSAGAITVDQRGVLRPQGPACDIGAFERSLLVEQPLATFLPLTPQAGS
ncbi:MAG: hypothetical protein KDE23_13035 [Caldilinea sp.]|nr:hypothetical protein [Caldilinea sp.]